MLRRATATTTATGGASSFRLSATSAAARRLAAGHMRALHSSPAALRAAPALLPRLGLVERAVGHRQRTAVVAPADAAVDSAANQRERSYGRLLADATALAGHLRQLAGVAPEKDMKEGRVAFLCPADYSYVATQWGIWSAGGVAVPIGVHHPGPEVEYVISNSEASAVVIHPTFAQLVEPIAHRLNVPVLKLAPQLFPAQPAELEPSFFDVDMDRGAHIVYTSGTTGRPKGVYTTHRNVEAQVSALVDAWGWTHNDHILNVLPLHHVHGIVAVLTSALWSGAKCEMMSKFDASAVWRRFTDTTQPQLSLFMAVPTVYAKLIEAYDQMTPEQQRHASDACRHFRLMVSGSAALPETIMARWQEISGHLLLERYGMTEFGMAISNPLHGQRRPGCVGKPLPGYKVVRILPAAAEGQTAAAAVATTEPGVSGDLQVTGPAVFKEYWKNPEATAKEFTADGWFKTGDIAEYVDESGVIRILGRSSVDILKSGGYKISALDVERVLLEHPAIAECAVVGLPDPAFGQTITAVVVLKQGAKELELGALKEWCQDRMSGYKVPRKLLALAQMPRNAMGKVNKKDLVKSITATTTTTTA